jgi:hypothetical protein
MAGGKEAAPPLEPPVRAAGGGYFQGKCRTAVGNAP